MCVCVKERERERERRRRNKYWPEFEEFFCSVSNKLGKNELGA